MPTSQIKIEYVRTDKLNPAGYNPRTISPEMMGRLKKSLQEFGFVDPIIVNKKTGNIVGGHQRYFASKELGLPECPVVYVNIPESREKQLNVLLNKVSGGWDYTKLFEVLNDVNEAGLDIDLTGWDFDILEQLSGIDMEFGLTDLDKPLIELQSKNENVILSSDDDEPVLSNGKVASLRDVYPVFPTKNLYGIPDLLPDKVASLPNDSFVTFTGRTQEIPDNVWIHCLANKLHPYKERNCHTFVTFFTWDEYFEAVWKSPAQQTTRLMNLKLGAIATPDFSTWWTDPIAVQIWAIYRRQWVGRYWQEAGLRVIPTVEVTHENTRNFALLGIPKNAECIIVQMQIKTKEEYKLLELKHTMSVLTPKTTILYGVNDNETSIKKLIEKYTDKVVIIKSWMDTRSQIRKQDSSQTLGGFSKTKKGGKT